MNWKGCGTKWLYRTSRYHFGTGMEGARKAYKNLLKHPASGSRSEYKTFRISRKEEPLCLSPYILNTFQQILHHRYASIRIYRTVRNCHILSFNEEKKRQVVGRTSPLWPACVHLGTHWVSLYQQKSKILDLRFSQPMTITSTIFWDVTLCDHVEVHCLQGRWVSQVRNQQNGAYVPPKSLRDSKSSPKSMTKFPDSTVHTDGPW